MYNFSMEDILQLTGRSLGHLARIQDTNFLINKGSLKSFISLRDTCKSNGFDLVIHSSFRDYKTQLNIWNEKALGNRDLLDIKGIKLDYDKLDRTEILFSIMRWSALPGMSRHHWGTEVDIYDLNTLPHDDYKVELTPQEVCPEGCFGKLHTFLDELIDTNKSFGFYRPYSFDLGGVSPEKWHLSHHQESSELFNFLSFELFNSFLDSLNKDEIQLLDLIKENKEIIYEKYIRNISPPSW